MAEEDVVTIRDDKEILKRLERAWMEDLPLEVQVNDRVRIYYTELMDYPVEEMASPGNPLPFAYLTGKSHLLVFPLSPAVGNAYIRGSREVTLRLFLGIKAHEMSVQFLAAERIGEEMGLRLSFPAEMRVLEHRRHYRAVVNPNLGMQAQMKKAGSAAQSGRVVNLSAQGVACCFIPESLPLALGETIQITLAIPSGESLAMRGVVRNIIQSSGRESCPQGHHQCGIQFDLRTSGEETAVEQWVALAQRDNLKRYSLRRSKMLQIMERVDPEVASNAEKLSTSRVEAELHQLFGFKRKYRFGTG